MQKVLYLFIPILFLFQLQTGTLFAEENQTPEYIYTYNQWGTYEVVPIYLNVPLSDLSEFKLIVTDGSKTTPIPINNASMAFYPASKEEKTLTFQLFKGNQLLQSQKTEILSYEEEILPEPLSKWLEETNVFEQNELAIFYGEEFDLAEVEEISANLLEQYQMLKNTFDIPPMEEAKINIYLIVDTNVWYGISDTPRSHVDGSNIFISPDNMAQLDYVLKHEINHIFEGRYLLSFYDLSFLNEGFADYYTSTGATLKQANLEYGILMREGKLQSPMDYMMYSADNYDGYSYSFGASYTAYLMEELGPLGYLRFAMGIPDFEDDQDLADGLAEAKGGEVRSWETYLQEKNPEASYGNMAKENIYSTKYQMYYFSYHPVQGFLLHREDTYDGKVSISRLKFADDQWAEHNDYLWDLNTQYQLPTWSPSGEQFIVYRTKIGEDDAKLVSFDAGDKSERLSVSVDPMEITSLAWVDEDNVLVSNWEGELYHLDMANQEFNRVDTEFGYFRIDVQEGSRLLLATGRYEASIFRLNDDYSVEKMDGPLMSAPNGYGLDMAVWNADGTKIAVLNTSLEDYSLSQIEIYDMQGGNRIDRFVEPYVYRIEWANEDELFMLRNIQPQSDLFVSPLTTVRKPTLLDDVRGFISSDAFFGVVLVFFTIICLASGKLLDLWNRRQNTATNKTN